MQKLIKCINYYLFYECSAIVHSTHWPLALGYINAFNVKLHIFDLYGKIK